MVGTCWACDFLLKCFQIAYVPVVLINLEEKKWEIFLPTHRDDHITISSVECNNCDGWHCFMHP